MKEKSRNFERSSGPSRWAQFGLVSWYSTHEKWPDGKPITAIYLADLVLQK